MRKPPAPKRGPAAAPPARPEAGERIAKVLARRGVASRRAAEEMIAAGRVSVNGRVIDSPALNVGPKDRIELDGRPLPDPAPMRLWLYHKPVGLVTTEKDEKGRPTVFGALPPELGRVMSVGRLDINSEGLLLLTNDGALKRRLELPATGWLRKYRVRVNGTPDEAALEPLRRGVEVAGETFQPMEVSLDRQQGANAWLTVGLREGRNREVRRAMEAVGLTVNRLIRVSYGPFRLGQLAPGAVEEVRPKVLRDQLGLTADARAAAAETGGRAPEASGRAGPHGGAKSGGARPDRAARAGGRTGRGGAGSGAGGGPAAEDSPRARGNAPGGSRGRPAGAASTPSRTGGKNSGGKGTGRKRPAGKVPGGKGTAAATHGRDGPRPRHGGGGGAGRPGRRPSGPRKG